MNRLMHQPFSLGSDTYAILLSRSIAFRRVTSVDVYTSHESNISKLMFFEYMSLSSIKVHSYILYYSCISIEVSMYILIHSVLGNV